MKKLLFALVIIILLAACTLSSPKNPKDYLSYDNTTWEELFKAYWSGLSDNYVFWSIDDQNGEWDDIYYEYLPKFRALGEINTNDMKQGILLLSDMSKNLSDGHFNFKIIDSKRDSNNKPREYVFSPSKYKIIKENNPNLSSDKIIEIMYEQESFKSYYPKELLNEKAQTILEKTFKLPLFVSPPVSGDYGEIKLIETDGKIVNPNIQKRITYDKQAILYSNNFTNGSYITSDGDIKEIEGSVPEGSVIGPYYPLSDLAMDGKNTDLLNSIFEDWTLFLGTSYQEYIEPTEEDPNLYNKKHSASLKLYSLAGITKSDVSNEKYEGDTAYLLLSNFFLIDYVSTSSRALNSFLNDFHEIKMEERAKGLILDLRGNGGGANIDREFIFGDLFSSPFKIGYQINKAGLGRHEYTIPTPIYVYPEPNIYNNEVSSLASKPVAVITNIMTVSNGEIATNIVKAFDKGKQVGGKTLGGQGTLSSDALVVNAGQFSIGNYITSVYTPFAQILDVNGNSLEGVGCIPDIPVEFNLERFNDGDDLRLTEAFKYIRESN